MHLDVPHPSHSLYILGRMALKLRPTGLASPCWISRAPSNSAASPDRSSLEVLNVKSAPVLRSASARAASSSSVRYTTALAPARASATIALRFSLSLKATTSGGRLSSMHSQDYRDSAREAALNMFDWRSPLEKSE